MSEGLKVVGAIVLVFAYVLLLRKLKIVCDRLAEAAEQRRRNPPHTEPIRSPQTEHR